MEKIGKSLHQFKKEDFRKSGVENSKIFSRNQSRMTSGIPSRRNSHFSLAIAWHLTSAAHFQDNKYVKQGFFLNKLLEMMRSVYFPSVLSATVVQISDIKVQQKVYQTWSNKINKAKIYKIQKDLDSIKILKPWEYSLFQRWG